MKLKTFKTKAIEQTTDIELPVYFYFQDELCQDELIKFDGNSKVTVKFEIDGYKIESERETRIPEHWIRNITTKDHFDETLRYVLEKFTKV